MNEFEGDDRREARYSNIQHAFIFKPETIMSLVITIAGGGIAATLWITSEIAIVGDMAKTNTSDINHVRQIQNERDNVVQKALTELTQRQAEATRQSSSQFDKLDRKLDKLIERELNRNGGQ